MLIYYYIVVKKTSWTVAKRKDDVHFWLKRINFFVIIVPVLVALVLVHQSMIFFFFNNYHTCTYMPFRDCAKYVLLCWSHAPMQDPSSLIRRNFVDKTFKLLQEHCIPCRYACAFALAASCSDEDLQKDVSLNRHILHIFGWAQAFSFYAFTMFTHNACVSHWGIWQNI